jgi:NADH dehydrogenase [ubiquinone] 1 alpha subcomplex assembly factor 3
LEVFEVVVPRPEILLLGTGKSIALPPPFFRTYLNGLGIQLDTMDTRNACSTYNLLAEEGRRVAAALIPYHPRKLAKKYNMSKLEANHAFRA